MRTYLSFLVIFVSVLYSTTDSTAQCPSGWALRFNGGGACNNYVRVPHSASLNVGNQLTVEAWVVRYGNTCNDVEYFLTKFESDHQTPTSGWSLAVSRTPDFWGGIWGVSGAREDAVYPSDAQWHHVAMTYDGSFFRLFLDGEKVVERVASGNIVNNTSPIWIGAQNGAYWGRVINGAVDEVRISKAARYTQSFIPQITPFSTDSSTIALYHFDEGTGNVANDASGNGNNGILVNSPEWICSYVPLPGTTVCGDVSGVWNVSGSPYYVNCDVNVPAGRTLEIGPGVEVLFTGQYKFNVYGNLQAIGTEEDSIIFSRAYPTEGSKGWGIRFYNADPACSLAYCVIENCHATPSNPTTGSGGGIYMTQSSPAFFGCSFRNNVADYDGGGVACFTGSPRFYESTIESNSAVGDAGGILFHTNCTPIMTNCIIRNNTAGGSVAGGGGGIYLHQSSLTLNNCRIIGNSTTGQAGGGMYAMLNSTVNASYCEYDSNLAAHDGGGIGISSSSGILSHCMFRNNRASWGGGANVNSGSSPTFSYCVFVNNSTQACGGAIAVGDDGETSISHCTFIGNWGEGWEQAAICIYRSTVTVSNSIIAFGSDYGVVFNNAPNCHLNFCSIYGNALGNIRFWSSADDGPANVGQINSTNVNGDPCDQYQNIFLNPLFVNAANIDFHLQSGSPCINAGDPNSPRDPDGTIADMGAFPFSDIILPVELATFSIASTSSGIRVTFMTASETDNDYFEILRGNSENGAFAKIAALPSQGNSTTEHRYAYLDRAVTSGQTYWYYLADVDLNGNRTEHRDLMQSATMSGAAELPSDYALSAYPNPFNPTTTISFALPEAGVVKIAVFDVAGRWIQTLVNEKRIAGNHTITFDARDLPSGVYFARMESGAFTVTKKMLLIR